MAEMTNIQTTGFRFNDYASLKDAEKAAILYNYDYALKMGATQGQAIAIAAHDTFSLNDRAWNGKIGSNAFAAACAVVLMSGRLGITK
jgi:hypothetical protein